jgi:putative SOS response-associated peptidase YedK
VPVPYTLSMCGRYRLARKKEILAEVFDVGDDDNWRPRYNIAPTQSVPVVRQAATRPVRSVSLIRWGLIPFWAKDAKAGYKMTNARAETLTPVKTLDGQAVSGLRALFFCSETERLSGKFRV